MSIPINVAGARPVDNTVLVQALERIALNISGDTVAQVVAGDALELYRRGLGEGGGNTASKSTHGVNVSISSGKCDAAPSPGPGLSNDGTEPDWAGYAAAERGTPMCESCDDPATVTPDGATIPCSACLADADEPFNQHASTSDTSAFDKACGAFYCVHNRLPNPVEIFAIAQRGAKAQCQENYLVAVAHDILVLVMATTTDPETARFAADNVTQFKAARPQALPAPLDHAQTLSDLLACFLAWEPQVRVLGNVRAEDAAAAISSVLKPMLNLPCAPAAWEVGLELYRTLEQARANVRNPDLTPAPLYRKPPAYPQEALALALHALKRAPELRALGFNELHASECKDGTDSTGCTVKDYAKVADEVESTIKKARAAVSTALNAGKQ
jgi:hypothetical protein